MTDQPVIESDDFKIATTQVRDIVASDLIREQMGIYGGDLASRQYPHAIDGLKKGQRRILWTMGPKPELTGLNTLIGQAEDIHTSGDTSIYSALVRMAQDFNVGHPLIHIEGFGGVYALDDAAAPRYIEARSTEFTKDVFFGSGMEKTLPMVFTRNFKTMEPIHFIPRIPTAMLFNHLTIGIGYKSISPQLQLGDLCDLMMRQVDIRTKTHKIFVPPKVMAKYIIPDYPVENYILNRQELLEEYSKGEYNTPIRLSGKLHIKDNLIVFKSLAFGYSYLNTYDKLSKRLAAERNKFWLFDMLKGFQNFSAKKTEFTLTFKNNINLFQLLDKIKPVMSMEDAIHPRYYYTLNDRITHLYPPQLLSLWYDERLKSILSGVKHRHMELTLSKMEKQARLIVCNDHDTVITLIRNSDDEISAIRALTDTFKELTQSQAKILANTPIKNLTRQSKITLQNDIVTLDKSIEGILDRYRNLDEVIYTDAQFIKKKYNTPRKTTFIEDQIGYVIVEDDGIMQFESPEELTFIMENNLIGARRISVHSYHPYLPNRVAVHKNRLLKFKYKNIPKELEATGIIEYPNNPMTFCKSEDNAAIVPGINLNQDENTQLQYTTKKFYGIRINGRVDEIDSKELSNRKSVSRGAKSNIIHTVPGHCKDMVVVHMHPMDINVLRFDRILYDGKPGKIITIPTLEINIIDVQPVDIPFMAFTVPVNCVNKIGFSYITIENIKGMFEKSNNQSLILNKLTGQWYSRYLKKHPTVSKILTISFPK